MNFRRGAERNRMKQRMPDNSSARNFLRRGGGLALATVAAATALACLLAACGTQGFVQVESANQSSRVRHVVIHFTSVDFAESMRLLTEREGRVSAHYLVPEPGDASYSRRRLRVFRLVDESQRAWHAGRSSWAGASALNASSIGIEVVNRSACEPVRIGDEPPPPQERCRFLEFDGDQMALVIELLADILHRYPGIRPANIVGHSDIAPGRRLDPGPTFPWRMLHKHGIGAWPDADAVARHRARFEANPPDTGQLQRGLAAYGYAIEETGQLDEQTRDVLRAFQMHFRPSDWSGEPDIETAAILFALLEKYRPGHVRRAFG